jgi:hypothetical protein
MARKQDNPDRGRKLDFKNGRPTPVDEDEEEAAEDGGDG